MQVVMFVIKLLPLIVELMRALEQAYPQSGWGPFRLSLLRKILGRVKDVMADSKLTMADVMPLVDGVVADLAEGMNAKPEAWVPPAEPAVTSATKTVKGK